VKIVCVGLFLLLSIAISLAGFSVVIYSYREARETHLNQYQNDLHLWEQSKYYSFSDLNVSLEIPNSAKKMPLEKLIGYGDETLEINSNDYYISNLTDYESVHYELKGVTLNDVGISLSDYFKTSMLLSSNITFSFKIWINDRNGDFQVNFDDIPLIKQEI